MVVVVVVVEVVVVVVVVVVVGLQGHCHLKHLKQSNKQIHSYIDRRESYEQCRDILGSPQYVRA
jgi:hypothetical protein